MITLEAGTDDRHGKGTAWRMASPKSGVVHLPTGAAFERALTLEFDPRVERYVAQPVPKAGESERLPWPKKTVWFYVELKSGRRELHCTEDLMASEEKPIRDVAERLHASGLVFVVFHHAPMHEMRLRNYIRLLGLVGESDGTVAVAAEQLRKQAKPDSTITAADLVNFGEKEGASRHACARAIASLIHSGTLSFDPDEDQLGPDTELTWMTR